MATYSDHNGYFIVVVAVAVQSLKLYRRMCLMCAAVAHASKESHLIKNCQIIARMCGQVKVPEWGRGGGVLNLFRIHCNILLESCLPKRYIVPFLASLDACVVQRLARHSEFPHGYTATEVRRPICQYVTVVGHLNISKLSCEPST